MAREAQGYDPALRDGAEIVQDDLKDGIVSAAKMVSESVGVDESGFQIVAYGPDGTSLDLTDASTPAQVTLKSAGGSDSRGADQFIPLIVAGYVTTTIAADNTTPIVTIKDSSGNSSGVTLADFSDADSSGHLASNLAATDITNTLDTSDDGNDIIAETTTAAADSGTAAGEAEIFVVGLLRK